MIEEARLKIPVARACEFLGLARASYYRKKVQRNQDPVEQELIRLAGEHPRYGYRRLGACCGLSFKRARNLMAKLQLFAKKRKRKPKASPQSLEGAKNLCVPAKAPGHILASDFTYIPMPKGFAYFAVTLDLYTRKVAGWSLSRRMHTDFVLDALQMALDAGNLHPGWIHHSDQGSQYTSDEFRQRITKASGQPSFSRKATPGDNAFVESFFSRFKDEQIYTEEIYDYKQIEELVSSYVLTYNTARPHSSLGYLSPEAFQEKSKDLNLNSKSV